MIITGFHAIEEQVLQSDNNSSMTVYYSKELPRVKKILALCDSKKVKTVMVDDKEIKRLCVTLPPYLRNARGIVLEVLGDKVMPTNVTTLDELVKDERVKTVLVLDGITDVHNIGSIARSALLFLCDVIVCVKSKNNAHNMLLDAALLKSSAGAASVVKWCFVNNLVDAIKRFQSCGFWVYGADIDGENLESVQFAQKALIVMGSEGNGMTRLVKDNVDVFVTIPMAKRRHGVDSLNVSVSAGIILSKRFNSQ